MNNIVKSFFFCALISLFLCTNLPASNTYCIKKKCNSGSSITMTFESDQLVVLQPVEVELKVSDPKGEPVSDALIFCSLYKPNVATGSNNPKLKATKIQGTYRGIVFFDQEGNWSAGLTINLPDGSYEEVTLEIKNVLPSKT